jgi:hypothetical protein
MPGPCLSIVLLLALAFLQVDVARGQSPAGDERAREPATPTSAPTQHLFTARVSFGASFGGDEAFDRSVAAGEGITLQAGATLIPFWTSWLALGMGVDFGLKYAATQSLNGGYSLRRFPLTPSAQALFRMSDTLFLRVAGGPYVELGVQLSPTGKREAMAIELDDALGVMAESGIFYRAKRFAVDAAIRYTALRYEGPLNADADASNLGVFFGIHYVL